MKLRFSVTVGKPRNRVAVAAQRCGAGAHRTSDRRQHAQRALRREIALLEKPPHRH